MITGVIKNKVDKIWTDIWAGGIANPLTVIEQLTYLMFIRSLDEKELEQEEFDNMTGEPIYNFAMQDVETKNWGLRHRTNIDVTGMYRIGRRCR